MSKINPVARAMLQNRKGKQVVPNKKKYNRKRDRHEHILSKQTTKRGGRDALRQARSEDDT